MFGPIGETTYDLRFSVFGIPVRVHPGFWLMNLIMGSQIQRMDLVVVWVACVFVSILVHELGHALVAKSYRWPVSITLHWMGGHATPTPYSGYTRGRAIWMSFAGPLAGFLLYGCVVAGTAGLEQMAETSDSVYLLLSTQSALSFGIMQLMWINLWWGLINLLPVYPLDGGQICGEVLNARGSYKGQMRTFQIGMVVGGLVALMFFNSGQIQSGILFAALAVQNYQNAEQSRRGY